ncbi:MAG: hypothetical protein QM765_47350 [Myxococcales bacterium]
MTGWNVSTGAMTCATNAPTASVAADLQCSGCVADSEISTVGLAKVSEWPVCGSGYNLASVGGASPTCVDWVNWASAAGNLYCLEGPCVSDGEIDGVGLGKVSGWPVCDSGTFLKTTASDGPPVCVSESDPYALHLTGNETAAGAKTFSTSVTTPTLTVTGGGYTHTINAYGATVQGTVSGWTGDFSQTVRVGSYTVGSLPAVCAAGALAWNTTDQLLMVCDAGSVWSSVSLAAALHVSAPITGAGTAGSPLTTQAASASQAGHVTTADQTFAGNKLFNGTVYALGGGYFPTLYGYDTDWRQGLTTHLAVTTAKGTCTLTFVDGLLTAKTGDCPTE